MNTQVKNLYCNECEHAVVSGMACDLAPALCPYYTEAHPGHQTKRISEAWRVVIASAEAIEYDAVRGQD